MRLHTPIAAAAALVLLQASPCSALTCDELRTDVETRIRAAGVSAFTVSIVDATATSAGRAVGTCDRGAKKLLYTQTAAGTAPRNLPARAEKKADTIITRKREKPRPSGRGGRAQARAASRWLGG